MKQQDDQLHQLRHSAAHLLAAAVLELYPNAKPAIGPATDDGFYYDFEFAEPISDTDLKEIEKRMKKMVNKWESFERIEVSKEDALERYKNNPYKVELIEEHSGNGEALTLYKSGEFVDLCKGGHIDEPRKQLRHFKLLSIAGAYWRGSEKNQMLTRIYGTAFLSAEELDEYLRLREEAKKRDHRVLGQKLELFFIDEMVGKGLIMWLPNGTILKDQVEALARKMEYEAGYERVSSPHIAKEELYLTSGHLPYYKDGMYPPMVMDDGTYFMKAMNCPHHHRMYLHKPHSYRELPIRYAEYGMCYRNELSGTLAGLLRVRALEMNDAHIYCRKDQIKSEFKAVLELTKKYFEIFGLNNYWFRLSKWSPEHTEKYINQPENWEYAENVLREVLTEMQVEFVEADDEAAFYGPKVDVQFKSIIGREETMSTIQLDFLAKERFGLSYKDENGEENNEVFVIHRAPLSTHERFMAFLIEHYGGNFPFWLSPIQVSVIPVTDNHHEYAARVYKVLLDAGIRVKLHDEPKTVSYKIRQSTLQKVPFMVIIGDNEVNSSTQDSLPVSVRSREGNDLGVQPVNELLISLKEQLEKYQ
jgi:threonyl-tRNA synthetase